MGGEKGKVECEQMPRVATQRRARTGTADRLRGTAKSRLTWGRGRETEAGGRTPARPQSLGPTPRHPLPPPRPPFSSSCRGQRDGCWPSVQPSAAPPGRAPSISLTQRPTLLSSPNSPAPGGGRRGVCGDIESQAGFPSDMSSLSCRSHHSNIKAVRKPPVRGRGGRDPFP